MITFNKSASIYQREAERKFIQPAKKKPLIKLVKGFKEENKGDLIDIYI